MPAFPKRTKEVILQGILPRIFHERDPLAMFFSRRFQLEQDQMQEETEAGQLAYQLLKNHHA